VTDRPHIILIGFRGAGKTTVGRLLAGRLGRAFADSDDLIVAADGRSIAQIFREDGEAEFRRLEARAIRDAVSRPVGVIAVGGGAVQDPANVSLLKRSGEVVWLSADATVLQRRIAADPRTGSDRPALAGASAIEEVAGVLARRESAYAAAASVVVDTSRLTPEEVARQILDAI